MGKAAPEGLSVIVPVYNEAGTVDRALPDLVKAAEALGVPFEILVCENGSHDGTLAIVERLALTHQGIRVEALSTPDYGGALQHGIRVAVYDKVVIFNVDFWSAEFLETALKGLDTSDMVVGSKVMGKDRRPLVRRLITRGFNAFLRAWFGFRGTDTHGMKAFRRHSAGHLAAACVSKGWTFDTELVLRAERAGLTIIERPVDITEIRPPSYASIVSRVPDVFRNLAVMQRALRTIPRR